MKAAVVLCLFLAVTVQAGVLDDLHRFEVVRPRLLEVEGPRARTQFATASMTSDELHPTRLASVDASEVPSHAKRAVFEVQGYGRTFILDLELNADLFGTGYVQTVVSGDGASLQGSYDREHCYYGGKVRGEAESIVAAATCDGLDAAIWVGGEKYVLSPHPSASSANFAHPAASFVAASAEGGGLSDLSHHVMYRKSDLKTDLPVGCGHEHDDEDVLARLRPQADPQPGHVSSPVVPTFAAATTKPRTLELLLVVDYDLFVLKGSTVRAAQDYAIRQANFAQQLYQKLNYGITISLVAVHTFAVPEPAGLRTSKSESMETYLQRVTNWRGRYNGKFTSDFKPCTSPSSSCFDLSNDIVMLLTGADRSGGVVGLAWVSAICENNAAGVVENNLQYTWQFAVETLTHEMGHTWGSMHDGDANGCSSSGNIMASSGCGSCPFSQWKDWSSCSKNYITNTLQSVESRPGNCLASTGRLPAAGGAPPRCGDGVVTAPEACDLGAENGPNAACSATCTLNPGNSRCTEGDCCNLASGTFKAPGTQCRQSVRPCDIPDFCTGNSATCGQDLVEPDGTTCTEGGSKGACHHGTCMSLDNQCAALWSGYTGHWVHSAQNGLNANCESECGELRCTNTEWKDYCFSYNCPAGNWCTINGKGVLGPNTKESCNCLTLPNAATATFVKDGTPCGATGQDKMCFNRQCVDRPSQGLSAELEACSDSETCTGHGRCANGGLCACDAGWHGPNCQSKFACDINCSGLRREPCRADNTCGRCLPGFATDDDASGSVCNLEAQKPSNVAASAETQGAAGALAMDSDDSSHWGSTFEHLAHPVASLTATYTKPFPLSRYALVSSYSQPAMDPAAWRIEGSNDGRTWETIDEKSEVMFDTRLQARSFSIAEPRPFSMYKLTVLAVRDADDQGGASVTTEFRTDGVNANSAGGVTVNNQQGPKPKVQLAELKLYSTASGTTLSATGTPGRTLFGLPLIPTACGAGAVVLFAIVVLIAGLWRCRKRASGSKLSDIQLGRLQRMTEPRTLVSSSSTEGPIA